MYNPKIEEIGYSKKSEKRLKIIETKEEVFVAKQM